MGAGTGRPLERRSIGAADVRRWLRSALEGLRGRPGTSRSPARTQRKLVPRLGRSRAGVALEARAAVRAGIRLDDFLRHRLARYAADLPVALEELPVEIDVEGGEPVVRAFRSSAQDLAATVSPGWQPGEAHFTGTPTEDAAGAQGPAARDEALDALEREIERRRRQA